MTGDYWVVVFEGVPNCDENKIDWDIDSITNLSDIVPIHSSNLFNLIKSGKTNWTIVNELLGRLSLRVRFNSHKLRGPFVFMTAPKLFKDTNELIECFNKAPYEFYKLIESRSELVQ